MCLAFRVPWHMLWPVYVRDYSQINVIQCVLNFTYAGILVEQMYVTTLELHVMVDVWVNRLNGA